MQIQVCLAAKTASEKVKKEDIQCPWEQGFPSWELPLSPLEPFRDIHVSQGNEPRAERVPRDGK